MPDTSQALSQFYVKIAGADATTAFLRDLVEVSVENSLHLPDVATLHIHDPRLQWIDDANLAPGKTIEIAAKASRAVKPIFDGEIVELEPDFSSSTPYLVVRAFDRLHRLARGRHVRSFLNVSDGDLVRKIAQEVGLQAKVGPTKPVYPYVLQRAETNLEFLHRRAAALGYVLYVQGRVLHCEAPKESGGAIVLEWGTTLGQFQPRMTTVGQVDSVLVRGWDPAKRQEIVGQAKNGQGPKLARAGESRGGGDVAKAAFNLPAQALVAERPIRSQVVADQVAQATADRVAGRFIQAEGSCGGNPAIVAGALVTIKAVGTRFSGDYVVTSATHIDKAMHGYSTHFSVSGHHPATLLSLLQHEPSESPPGGLAIGVVTDNQDPEGQGRVKVKFPCLSGEHASDWARVAVPGGGPQRGVEFLPEVNDEVLVAFEGGDIHHTYILGGLWNGKDAPPQPSTKLVSGGKVQKRIIRSRTGHQVTLDDADGGGGITIEDPHGNKIVIDTSKDGLTIEVKKDALLKVGGDLTLKANGKIALEATGQVAIKGQGVQIDGGAATVDVKGTAINLN